MKKSIVIVVLSLITAIGCSRNTGMSKYAGTWSGSYSSTIIATNPNTFDTGTLQIVVDANNGVTGTLQSLHGGAPAVMKGGVDPSSGTISLSEYGKGDYGIDVFLAGLNGNLTVESGNGMLVFPWATRSKWQAAKN